MRIGERLDAAKRLFLDTAPVIYFVERNPKYLDRVRPAFERIDAGALMAVTSPITLAECLVVPYRLSRPEATRAFADRIIKSDHTTFFHIDQRVAEQAAELRARYNLSLTDAFQAALALSAECDAFLTNDGLFKRVAEVNVIVLDDMES
jgi:predicted nucleic acid-binding protein